MAMHMAGTPVAALASVHCAAATENFYVLENHSVDIPRWNDLFDGLTKPLIHDGYIEVPETPGLGLGEINLECMEEFIDHRDPLRFDPTNLWDNERSHDRLWS